MTSRHEKQIEECRFGDTLIMIPNLTDFPVYDFKFILWQINKSIYSFEVIQIENTTWNVIYFTIHTHTKNSLAISRT